MAKKKQSKRPDPEVSPPLVAARGEHTPPMTEEQMLQEFPEMCNAWAGLQPKTRIGIYHMLLRWAEQLTPNELVSHSWPEDQELYHLYHLWVVLREAGRDDAASPRVILHLLTEWAGYVAYETYDMLLSTGSRERDPGLPALWSAVQELRESWATDA